MSFIPEDKREKLNEDNANTDSNVKADKNDSKPTISVMKSVGLLVIIFCGLFLMKSYLTGEKEIVDFSLYDVGNINGKESDKKAKTASLELPRTSDKELRELLKDFKTGFEEIYNTEAIAQMEPNIKTARFSKDRTSLLIEMVHYEILKPATYTEDSTIKIPANRVRKKYDIIFKEDEFGRLVTEEFGGVIKLYPEVEEQ